MVPHRGKFQIASRSLRPYDIELVPCVHYSTFSFIVVYLIRVDCEACRAVAIPQMVAVARQRLSLLPGRRCPEGAEEERRHLT